jgi:hypothetical protein
MTIVVQNMMTVCISSDNKPHTHSSTRSVSNTSPKDKDTKPTINHIKTTTDNDSTAKKTSSAKPDDHGNSKQSDDSTSQ